jgi:hypothetical protein
VLQRKCILLQQWSVEESVKLIALRTTADEVTDALWREIFFPKITMMCLGSLPSPLKPARPAL